MRYSCAHETMPLIEARKPWFCISIADLHAGEVRAGRDADPFLFLGEPDQRHPRIVLGHSDEVDQPGFRQRRDEPDPARPERVVDQPGVSGRDGHFTLAGPHPLACAAPLLVVAGFAARNLLHCRRRVPHRTRLRRDWRVSRRHHALRLLVREVSEDDERLFSGRPVAAVVGDLLHDRRDRDQHAVVHRRPGAGVCRAT